MAQDVHNSWQWLNTWGTKHPWGLALVVAGILSLGFVLVYHWLSGRIVRRVERRIFGPDARLPTIRETTRQVQQAQHAAAQTISDIQAAMMNQVQTGMRDMHEHILQMERQVRDGHIPLALAVTTREERQVLEAALARSNNIRATIQTRRAQRSNKKAVEEQQEATAPAPTAWTRILEDDDEEGIPCPTKNETPKEEAPKSNPVQKRPKARKRRTTIG